LEDYSDQLLEGTATVNLPEVFFAFRLFDKVNNVSIKNSS
jgi:hypothetical protein